MNLEGGPATQETREERLAREYHEAVLRYEALKESAPEAQDILFQDRPAETPEEHAVASLTLQKEACEGEAEASAERGEMHAERAMRMLEQLKDAEVTILGLYCDAKNDSEEFAALIRAEHPWVETLLDTANNDSFEQEEVA